MPRIAARRPTPGKYPLVVVTPADACTLAGVVVAFALNGRLGIK